MSGASGMSQSMNPSSRQTSFIGTTSRRDIKCSVHISLTWSKLPTHCFKQAIRDGFNWWLSLATCFTSTGAIIFRSHPYSRSFGPLCEELSCFSGGKPSTWCAGVGIATGWWLDPLKYSWCPPAMIATTKLASPEIYRNPWDSSWMWVAALPIPLKPLQLYPLMGSRRQNLWLDSCAEKMPLLHVATLPVAVGPRQGGILQQTPVGHISWPLWHHRLSRGNCLRVVLGF